MKEIKFLDGREKKEDVQSVILHNLKSLRFVGEDTNNRYYDVCLQDGILLMLDVQEYSIQDDMKYSWRFLTSECNIYQGELRFYNYVTCWAEFEDRPGVNIRVKKEVWGPKYSWDERFPEYVYNTKGNS